MKDDTVYLRHILERIRRIEENTALGRDQFLHAYYGPNWTGNSRVIGQ